jgi:hypothetical protein
MKRILALLPFIGFISVSSSAAELEISTGFGHQYGGILGAQFAKKSEFSKYYISTGLLGASVGFETTFQKNSMHSYGLAVGAEAVSSEKGFAFATYNYHFNGFSNNGLVLGTGIGIRRSEYTLGADDTETSYSLTLNIAYKF